MPDEVEFVNKTLGDKELRSLVADTYSKHGPAVAVKMLDSIKDIGFKYATLFGATIGVNDIVIPEKKKEMIETANTQVKEIQEQYIQGHITQEERYNRVIEVWSKTNEDLTNELMNFLKEADNGFNPVYLMADSGAREAGHRSGSWLVCGVLWPNLPEILLNFLSVLTSKRGCQL